MSCMCTSGRVDVLVVMNLASVDEDGGGWDGNGRVLGWSTFCEETSAG